jgi:RHS repeat-associated protein
LVLVADAAPWAVPPAGGQEDDQERPELLERLDDLQPWQPDDDPQAPPVPPTRSAERLKDVPLDADAPEAHLPGAGKATVKLGGERKQAGRLAVELGAGTSRAEGRELAVEVLDHAAAQRAGASGFVFKVSAEDGSLAGDGKLPVDLAVDYSAFADAFGAGYGDRLELRALPACALDEQPAPGCASGGVKVPARNNGADDELVVDVDDLRDLTTAEVAATAGSSRQAPDEADSDAAVFAVTAGPGGELEGNGDFKATPFELSSDWDVGVGSGEFSWSYSVPLPTPPAGSGPSLALSYSSGSVDGLTSNRNTQASPSGLGWGDLANAFVERRYTSCADDPDAYPTIGDLCWKNDNAVLSMNGRSSQLVAVPNSNPKQWRLKRDPRWRIEQLTGTFANGDSDKEYWKVTTPDGVQYFFGLGVKLDGTTPTSSVYTVPVVANNDADATHPAEPCRGNAAGNISENLCQQGWRWNLDRVVDPNGNATMYQYSPETNYYRAVLGLGGWQPYIRAGRLRLIEYGANTGAHNGGTVVPAQARVDVGGAHRCQLLDPGVGVCKPPTTPVPGTTPDTIYPDVPIDQICASPTGSGCGNLVSPTFFTTVRYTKLTTQVLVGGQWKNVDEIALTHEFKDESAGANKNKLYLIGVQRTGVQGTPSVTLPGITFGLKQLDNRAVNSGSTASKMPHYRLETITDEFGRKVTATYGQPHPCPSPLPTSGWDDNKWNCFRQQYLPEGATDPNWGVFHKYLVTQVKVEDGTGGSPAMTTSYAYGAPAGDTTGDAFPAWHYDADAFYKDGDLQWSDWRGYDTVTVTQGTSKTRFRVFRGMHRDRTGTGGERTVDAKSLDGTVTARDFDWLAGETFDEAKLAGDGSVLQGAIHEYTYLVTVDDDGIGGNEPHPFKAAVFSAENKVTNRTKKDGGGFVQTRATTGFNGFLGFPETVYEEGRLDVSGDERCSKTGYVFDVNKWMLDVPSSKTLVKGACTSTTVLSESQTAYDGGAVGAAPTRGNPSNIRSHLSGSTWAETKTTYDALGRPKVVTDANGKNTTVTHTPATGYATKTETTNHLGHKSTTNWLLERQVPASQVDARSKITTYAYDALGRSTKVWQPTEPTSGPASWEFIYTVDTAKAKPPVLRTRQLQQTTPSTVYLEAWTVYDSLARERQSQRLSPASGKVMVSNTAYDDRGLLVSTSLTQAVTGTAGNLLALPAGDKWDNETTTIYDELGRPVWELFLTEGTHQWLTTSEYGHDTVKVTPRAQTGAASSGETVTTFDAYGNATKVAEWATRGDSASAKNTSYAYDVAGRLTKVTDPRGNTIDYTYDLAGRQITMADRDAGSWTYGYDLAGNQTSIKDARNVTTTVVYDAINRPTMRHAGDPTKPLVTWNYDKAGETGLLDSAVRWVRTPGETDRAYVTDALGYDDRGRVTGRSWVFFDKDLPGVVPPSPEGSPFPVTYEYDRADHVTKTVYPQIGDPGNGGLVQETVTTTYSTLGLPVGMDGTALPADQDYLYAAGYDDRARPVLFGFGKEGSGVAKLWLYDANQRLTSQQAAASGTMLQDRTFTYQSDPMGKVIKRKNTINAKSWMDCYGYDDRNRLTKAYSTTHTDDCAVSGAGGGDADTGYNHTYTYSDDGNITQRVEDGNTIAYTYPAPGATSVRPHAPTRLDFPGGGDDMDYTWDANGHMLTRVRGGTTETFTWDPEQHLDAVETRNATGSSTSSFTYDSAGNRLVRRDVERNTAYFEGHEVSVSNGGKVTSVRTYRLAGAAIATRSASGGDDPNKDKVEYLITDSQGSIELTARNSESTPVVDRTYTPYGAKRTGNDAQTDQGWIGQIEDHRSGLNYLNNRYYDPNLYRFISPDPLADLARPQTLNPYAYGINNPVTFLDPSGMCAEEPPGTSPPSTEQFLGNQNETDCPQDEPPRPPITAVDLMTEDEITNAFVCGFASCPPAMQDNPTDQVIADTLCESRTAPCTSFFGTLETLADALNEMNAAIADIFIGDYLNCIHDPGFSLDCASVALDLVPIVGKLDNVNDARRAIEAGFDAADAGRDAERAAEVVLECARSFGRDTPILMADGSTKPISEIEAGDWVLATDPETGQTGSWQVMSVLVHDDRLVDLQLTGGAALTTTEDHPFWNATDRRWQESQVLDRGDQLLTADGGHVGVEGLAWSTAHRDAAYNLTVSGLHTYFVVVGGDAVLVHNCGPFDLALKVDNTTGSLILDGDISGITQDAVRAMSTEDLVELEEMLEVSVANRRADQVSGAFEGVEAGHVEQYMKEERLLGWVQDAL